MSSYAEQNLVRGLSFLAERQAAIANNLANVDTTSYKRRVAVADQEPSRFHAMLAEQMPTIRYREQSDYGRGIVRQTDNQLDVALDANSWLRVQNAGGAQFFTRNGQLQIAKDGRLTTRGGEAVLDTSGNPIQLGAGELAPSKITISPNGQIQDPITGQTWGPIAIVAVDKPDGLQPTGDGLYIDTLSQKPTTVGDGLQQGFLEGSNVDSLQELVQMITVERSFAATQKALTGVGRLQENIIASILR
ncbi:MAG: flagellar hook basal-body protein [Planctomycetes bacterium]|nr:flagellar hook basal-body protein [Planctomycetota bacterium]MCB9884572.1 flagellar hook basal-body protein [Planctomycetota bacterium]